MEGRRGLIPARPRHAQPQRAGRGVRHRGHRQAHLRLHDGQRPPARRVQDPRLRGGSGQPGFGRGRPRRVEGVRAGRPMAGRHGTGPRLGSTGQDQRRAVHHLPEDHRARHLPHRPVRPGRLQERHGPVRHQTAALRLGRQRDHHLPGPARTRPRAQARGPQRPRAPPGRRIRLPGHRLRHRPAALRRARRPRRVRPGHPHLLRHRLLPLGHRLRADPHRTGRRGHHQRRQARRRRAGEEPRPRQGDQRHHRDRHEGRGERHLRRQHHQDRHRLPRQRPGARHGRPQRRQRGRQPRPGGRGPQHHRHRRPAGPLRALGRVHHRIRAHPRRAALRPPRQRLRLAVAARQRPGLARGQLRRHRHPGGRRRRMEDHRHPRLAHPRRARPVVLGLQRLPPGPQDPRVDEHRDRAPDPRQHRHGRALRRRRGVGPARGQRPQGPRGRQLRGRPLLRLRPGRRQVGRQPRPGARPAVRRHDARLGPLRGLRARRVRRQRARPHRRRLPHVLRPAPVQHRDDGVPGQGSPLGARQGPLREERDRLGRRAP